MSSSSAMSGSMAILTSLRILLELFWHFSQVQKRGTGSVVSAGEQFLKPLDQRALQSLDLGGTTRDDFHTPPRSGARNRGSIGDRFSTYSWIAKNCAPRTAKCVSSEIGGLIL